MSGGAVVTSWPHEGSFPRVRRVPGHHELPGGLEAGAGVEARRALVFRARPDVAESDLALLEHLHGLVHQALRNAAPAVLRRDVDLGDLTLEPRARVE